MKKYGLSLRASMIMVLIIPMLISCKHVYESDELDLSFYQWNQWPDEEVVLSKESNDNPPSCGWDVLHRGNGSLVRIPATIEGYKGVSWYHCRFTLPELWASKDIILMFDGAGPEVEVYLNEIFVGNYYGNNEPFDLDVTGTIYYTLDNHLAIRITDPEGGGGMTGILVVKSKEAPGNL